MAAGIALAGVLGALIGSFLTVVAHRVPAGESIVAPGSACPHCGRAVRWRENVPVVSWVLLRGRCAGCHARVSWKYPAIESATAACFAAVVAVKGVEPELALALPLTALLVVLAVIDLERRVLPNPIVLFGAVFAVIAGGIVDLSGEPERLIAGAAAFAVFLFLALAKPGGMGMGDVKLAGMMGLFLGLEVVPAMLIAFLGGSLVGLAVIARGGAAERKRAIPFGPFLALGGFIALLAGSDLVDLYRDTFL